MTKLQASRYALSNHNVVDTRSNKITRKDKITSWWTFAVTLQKNCRLLQTHTQLQVPVETHSQIFTSLHPHHQHISRLNGAWSYNVEDFDDWSWPWTHKCLTAAQPLQLTVLQRWKLWWMELSLNTQTFYLLVIVCSVYGHKAFKSVMTEIVLGHKTSYLDVIRSVYGDNVESCDGWSCSWTH